MQQPNQTQIIVNSRIKAIASEAGLQLSSESLELLNRKALELLEQAMQRTRANKRSTIRPQDF